MESSLSQLQRQQITLITWVTPYAMAGHLLNTTVLAIAMTGSVPPAQLIIWCLYSYAIALLLLYRHLKNLGRSPRSFQRAEKKATIFAVFLALPWSSLVVLYAGALSHNQELVLAAVVIGMAATGTILLSAMPPAALSYISVILIPSALKCLVFYQRGYLLLGALALSCWGVLAALIVKTSSDISERKKAEQALAERNLQLALAGKSGLVCSYAYDPDTELMQVSEGYAAIHGLPDAATEIARSEWRAKVVPEDLARLDGLRAQAFFERRSEYNTDYRIVRFDGEMRWIESRSFISYGSDGRPKRVVGVNIDVTERKQAEEHQRALVAELDHRVKNALATVSVVACRTMDASSSKTDFVAALDGRIKSMAIAHELLSVRRGRGLPLAELIRREFAPYIASNNIEIEGPEVMLGVDAGQAIAMVLHELVTNAAKYGALSSDVGRVRARWYWRLKGNTHDHLVFEWQEMGGPTVVAPSRIGYGTSVIRQRIPYELDGSVELTLAPEGARCRLELPADCLSRDSRSRRPKGSGSAQSSP